MRGAKCVFRDENCPIRSRRDSANFSRQSVTVPSPGLLNWLGHGLLLGVPAKKSPNLQTIHLQRAAPAKPDEGQACNGCGVCCALETCPAARLRFLQKRGPCPALEWSGDDSCYRCGLLTRPGHYLGWLPPAGQPFARRLFARWIAAGQGCDCNVNLTQEATNTAD